MKLTNTLNKLAVLTAFTVVSGAQASTLHIGPLAINFGGLAGTNTSSSTMGNTRTFSTGGLDVSSTAWSLTSLSADFAGAQLGRSSGYGLWVCNPAEGVNCSSPNHQIDNSYGFEFVLFQFSAPVDPTAISIQTYSGSDLDVSYYLGNTASNLSLAGVNLSELAGLGFSSRVNNDYSGTGTSRTVSITNDGGVNSLLIGTRISGDSKGDAFKLASLNVTTIGVSEVPEPGTFALTGVALVSLGLLSRRKKA